MKNTSAIKRKTCGLLFKNLIIIAALFIAAFAGVWSWMTNRTHASASGITMECDLPDGVEYQIVAHGASIDPDKWVKGSMKLSAESYDFLEDLSIREVTGDGTLLSKDSSNVSLYRPKLTQSGSSVSVVTSEEMTKAVANQDYISFDLYVRSESNNTLNLNEETSIYPNNTSLESSDGNYPKDAVTGAVRCSINGTASGNLLWIPAPNIFYDPDSGTLYTNRTSGDSYKHSYDMWYNSMVIKTTKVNVIANNDLNNPYTLGVNKKLLTLTQNSLYGEGYYGGKVNFNVWVEGEDNEARGLFAGGQFNIKIVITTSN